MAKDKEKGQKREFSLKVLARHGIIKPGTEIEVVPAARLKVIPPDSNFFRARIDDPSKLNQITWLENGITDSLTQLTLNLKAEHALKLLKKHTSFLWRIVGQDEPLSVQAERLQFEEARQVEMQKV